MNLQQIDPDCSKLRDDEKWKILHEFGHTLGFLHEHQSPARITELTFDDCKRSLRSGAPIRVLMPSLASDVYKYYDYKAEWPREVTESEVTNIINEEKISNYTDFDPKSIIM